LNFARQNIAGRPARAFCALPARFAGLSRAIAVILIRESAALLASAPSIAAVGSAVSTAVSVVPTAAAASTRAGGSALGTRFVHFQIAPPYFFSIEARNRLGCFRVVWHFHKSEAAGSAGLAVGRNVNARNLPERFKQRTQIRLGRLEAHVADE
jgi:hypothetical protein